MRAMFVVLVTALRSLSAVFVAACLTLAAQAGCGKATARAEGTDATPEGTAAAQRTAVADEVSPIPSGCGEDAKAAVKARFAALKEEVKAEPQKQRHMHEALEKITTLEGLLTEELNKPAGAARVKRLQDLEAEILVRKAALASEMDEVKSVAAKTDARLAEINAVMARCNNFAAP